MCNYLYFYFGYLNFKNIFFPSSTEISDSDRLLVALEAKNNELIHIKQQLAHSREVTNSLLVQESQNPSKPLQPSQVFSQPVTYRNVYPNKKFSFGR